MWKLHHSHLNFDLLFVGCFCNYFKDYYYLFPQASVTEMVECQVMAFDQRGHGETQTQNDGDLSAERLARYSNCI